MMSRLPGDFLLIFFELVPFANFAFDYLYFAL